MKISKLLMLGVIVVAVCAVQSMAATITIVSDNTTPIVGIYDKSNNLQPAMTTVSQNAVRAWEPRNSSSYWFGPYIDPTADTESDKSLWDSRFPLADYTYLQSVGADWIWDTAHAEGSAAPGTAPYGTDPSLVGHVVVFEKTFNIDGIPTDGELLIEADNCWEVRINGNFVDRADTCVAGWELTDLHDASVKGLGWASDSLTVDVTSYLTSGQNTLTILAGNEYHGWDIYNDPGSGPDGGSGQGPVPAWNQVPYVGNNTYYQYNPGALIFALDVEYEVPTYDICGTKYQDVEEGEDIPLQGWTINLYDVNDQLIDTTTTDANGEYCFIGLSAGEYFVGEGLEAGWTQVFPDETMDWGYYITLPGGETLEEGPFYDFFNVPVEQEGFCTFTQGAYGTAGGAPSYELLEFLVGDGVVVGVEGVASLTFDSADCIIERLPAGGTPAVLPEGDLNCDDNLIAAGLVKKNKMELNNTLIGQVVTLTLNIRLNESLGFDLGDFVLPGTEDEDGVFCTAYEGECPVQNIITKKAIAILGEGATVYDLLDAANEALGTPGTSKSVLSALNDAINTINEAFDECADLVECATEEICGNGCDDDFDGLIDEGCIVD